MKKTDYYSAPVVIQLRNTTDKIKLTSLFGLYNHNNNHDGIEWSNIQGTQGLSDMKLFLSKKKMNVKNIRLTFSDKNTLFNNLRYNVVDINGIVNSWNLFSIFNAYTEKPFITSVIEAGVDFDLDGFSTDIELELHPKETITVAMYESCKLEKNYPFNSFLNICVENNSNKKQLVNIFDEDSYGRYVKEGNVKFYPTTCNTCWGTATAGVYNYFSFLNSKWLKGKTYTHLKICTPNGNKIKKIFINASPLNLEPTENKISKEITIKEPQNLFSFTIEMPPNTKAIFGFGNKRIKPKKFTGIKL